MADNTINIKLEVNDGGKLAEKTKRAKELNDQLKQMSTGTQSGSAAMAASAKYSNQAYSQASGVIGKTGAGARDFAAESQGLGGLVRLYATYAANLFAVTAAFNALRDAMATTNMIEGLNQLGAQSGQALGTLAKNFAAASGGAISLREAMEATAKGSAAGLSSKQMMQLGDVAKKASLALGVNMTDAVSRLSRGITKLEPELLDELGIFTKVGKATEDYAKSVGKSVDSLTDFEKRQAFANAVLKEGADKFGSIDIDANPYDKLVASLKNIAQTGLEVVNKVLGPLINLLSQSPTALGTSIAALGALLLKQALPAIGQYRQGLIAAAETAKKAAEIRSQEAGRAVEAAASVREAALDKAAEKELRAVKAAAKQIEEVRDSGFSRNSKALDIVKKKTTEVTQVELDYLKKVGDRYEKQGKQDIADRYYKAITAITASAQAEKAYQVVADETTKKLTTQQGVMTALGQAQIQAARTRDIAASKSIVSSAAENTAILGMSGAWTKMREQVKESEMGPIRKGFTTLSSGISIASTAIMGLVGAMQTWIFIIGGVVAGIRMLDSYLTKNSEQSDAFNKAIDNSNEAVKNYDRTLKALSKLDPGLIFSSQGVTAQANAFKELADNLSIVREKFQELDKATTGWDRFWDGVFGKSQGQKFAEAAVSNISKIIAAVNDPKQREQLAQKVNEVLGTKGTTGLEWIEALKKGGPEAIALVKQIEEAIKPLSTQQSIAASRSKEFDEQLKKLTESYKAFAFSAVEKSPMTTLGNDMVTFAVKTVGALEDTENGLANMLNLMNSSKEIGMFSTETFTQLLKMKTEVEALNNAHGETRIKLQAVRQEEAALRLEYEQVYKRTGGITRSQASMQAGLTGSSKPLQDALELEQASIKLNDKLAERQKLQKKDTEEIQKIAQLMSAPVFGKAVAESFTIGANLVSQSIQLAFSKANADLQKGILANISDLPGTAALQRSAEQQDFNVQRLQLNVQQQMLKAQYLMIAAQNQTTAAVTLEKAKTEEAGRDLSGPSRGMRSDNPLNLEAAQRSSDLATQFSNMLAGDGKGAQALINSLTKEINTLAKSGGLDPTKVANLQQMLNASQSFMGISGKLAGIQTGETLSDLKEKIGLDKEKQKIQEQINNLIKTKAQSQLSALDIIQQQNEFLTVQQTQQKNNLQVEINAIDYATKLLGITQEEQKFEKSVQELKKAGKDTTQLEALTGESLAQKRLQAYLEYATLQEKTVAQGALATNKALEEERKSREKIKRIVEDTQAQLNRAYTEEKSIILSNQSKYERANEERIAGQKYSNELLKIADETREKTIALDRAWEDKKAEIAAKRGRTALGEAGDEARARLKAEEEAEEDKYKRLTAAEKRLADAKREGARIDKELAESKYREQEALRVLKLTELEQELINIRARGRLEVEELDLQYYTNSEKFSQQELANLKYRLEALKLEQDLKEKTQSSELSYLKEKRRLEGELERVDPEDISAITQILNELNLLKTKRDFETGTYREIYAAKKRLLELDASLTERQKAYGDVFKKTFEGMADAIVEFVKTGKLDFKSLIDSMLSDLLRFELRQQTLALYQSARPGLMNFFGGGGSGPSTFVNDAGGLEVAGSLGFAKGGAFDYGIERFAMGGAFTNKIINSPTLFKFAQGTGLMGEAGPEAIMPLKRDGQGNLGVRSASPKTEVVINNYGSEQATATETTDSQGNRRIEVAIGDMTAGEMSRSGSASQRSLRNTYGLQPQLIRR